MGQTREERRDRGKEEAAAVVMGQAGAGAAGTVRGQGERQAGVEREDLGTEEFCNKQEREGPGQHL